MSKLVAFFKSLRIRPLLTACVAGLILLLNTACSNATQARMPSNAPSATRTYSDDGPHPVGQNQPYEGGMNNFSDTAPGQAADGTNEKVKALVEHAKDVRADNPQEYVENLKENGRAVERAKDTVRDVKGKARNAQEEAKDVADRLERSGERTGDRAKELAERIKEGAGNVKDNIKRSGEEVVDNTKRTAEGAKDILSDAAKSNTRKAGNAAQNAADKTGRAIDDAVN